MNNITIIIPCYNDWECLNILLPNIDKSIINQNYTFRVLIINDSPLIKNNLKIKNINNIKSIDILNLKKNVKAQIAIATGLEYLYINKYYGGIIVMDADGQDDPKDIIKILNKIKTNSIQAVTINRLSRSEGALFVIMYYIYIFIASIFLLKDLRFGVFSYIHSDYLEKITKDHSANFAYVGSLAKISTKKTVLYTHRKKRYTGEAQNNFLSLTNYALKIFCIFKKKFFLNSIILLFLIFFLLKSFTLFSLVGIGLIIFNLIIFFVYLKNKKNITFKRQENISTIENIL